MSTSRWLKNSKHEIREIQGSVNYWCSSTGVIYRKVGNGYYIVPASKTKMGYMVAPIRRSDEEEPRDYRVHNIIAITWLERPRVKSRLVHIDNDKTNNDITNLHYIPDGEDSSEFRETVWSRSVYRLTDDYEVDEEYPSVRAAARSVCCSPSNIYRACKTTKNTAAGFMWQYKDDYIIFHRSRVLAKTDGSNTIKEYRNIHDASIENDIDPYALEMACNGGEQYIDGYSWVDLDDGAGGEGDEGEEESDHGEDGEEESDHGEDGEEESDHGEDGEDAGSGDEGEEVEAIKLELSMVKCKLVVADLEIVKLVKEKSVLWDELEHYKKAVLQPVDKKENDSILVDRLAELKHKDEKHKHAIDLLEEGERGFKALIDSAKDANRGKILELETIINEQIKTIANLKKVIVDDDAYYEAEIKNLESIIKEKSNKINLHGVEESKNESIVMDLKTAHELEIARLENEIKEQEKQFKALDAITGNVVTDLEARLKTEVSEHVAELEAHHATVVRLESLLMERENTDKLAIVPPVINDASNDHTVSHTPAWGTYGSTIAAIIGWIIVAIASLIIADGPVG